MKTIFALLALAFSTVASSSCYLIYTPSNEVVWRGNTAPVSMDKLALDAQVQKMVPKGHLVIVDTVGAPCTSLDLTTETTKNEKVGKTKFE